MKNSRYSKNVCGQVDGSQTGALSHLPTALFFLPETTTLAVLALAVHQQPFASIERKPLFCNAGRSAIM